MNGIVCANVFVRPISSMQLESKVSICRPSFLPSILICSFSKTLFRHWRIHQLSYGHALLSAPAFFSLCNGFHTGLCGLSRTVDDIQRVHALCDGSRTRMAGRNGVHFLHYQVEKIVNELFCTLLRFFTRLLRVKERIYIQCTYRFYRIY